MSNNLNDVNKRQEELIIHNTGSSSQKEIFLDLPPLPEIDPETIELYQNQSKIRKQILKILVDYKNWSVFYDILVPEVFCKNLARVGPVINGGKWICNPVRVRDFSTCILYSLGIANNPTFEEEFARFTNKKCYIRGVDKEEQYAQTLTAIKESNGSIIKTLVSPETNKSADSHTVKSIMRIFNDKKIDILKVDIEESEYIIDELLTIPICQMLIKTRTSTPTQSLEILKKISKEGYYLFSHEINSDYPTLCEYSFIHESCLRDYGVNIILGKYLS
ncbi:hypothetical protein FO519_010347 [Halicephalobus sp. NKZ332]|nr:hypothetical protein FO519_010347 [Halicephalobus sp. NKZ332]